MVGAVQCCSFRAHVTMHNLQQRCLLPTMVTLKRQCGHALWHLLSTCIVSAEVPMGLLEILNLPAYATRHV